MISWVKPNTCTEDNRTDKNKQTEISHIRVAVFSSSQADIPLGSTQKGKGRGNTNSLHPAFEDGDNLLLLKSRTKQASSASMLELETVRIGGLIPGSNKSRSIKQSSAPLCQTGPRHKFARTTATAELLIQPEAWLSCHSYHWSKTAFPQCSDYYYPFTMPK